MGGEVETVMNLVRQKPDDIVKVGIDADELAVAKAESRAVYGGIHARQGADRPERHDAVPCAGKTEERDHRRECCNKAKSERKDADLPAG